MKQCPRCGMFTVDFDEYFGRYRCFNASCSWMPPSASERRLRLAETGCAPEELDRLELSQIGRTITVRYDQPNDALLFDFGTGEASYEYPTDDARVSVHMGRHTGQVCGVVVYGAKEFGVSEIHFSIVARVEQAATAIEERLAPLTSGKPSKAIIEEISVTLRSTATGSERRNAIMARIAQATNQFAVGHVQPA